MNMTIADENAISKLEKIQDTITLTENGIKHIYACDCTGCSNDCFECCSDGMGYSN